MSKTILTQVDGWTPLIDELCRELGLGPAAVFGRMWRYCQGENGVCYAAQGTIAEELGLSRITVLTHIHALVSAGYLEDLTPDRSHAPHTYRDTGKAGIRVSISADPAQLGVKKFNTSEPEESKILTPGVKIFNTKIELRKNKAPKKEKETPAIAGAPGQPETAAEAPAQVTAQDPAIQLFRKITHRYPAKDQFALVAQLITEHAWTEEYLTEIWRGWRVIGGYSPTSLVWLTEWAVQGKTTNGKGPGALRRPPAGRGPTLKFDYGDPADPDGGGNG